MVGFTEFGELVVSRRGDIALYYTQFSCSFHPSLSPCFMLPDCCGFVFIRIRHGLFSIWTQRYVQFAHPNKSRPEFISRKQYRPFASRGNRIVPIRCQSMCILHHSRQSHISLVCNVSHDAGEQGNIYKGKPGGSRRPAEVHVSVLLHSCSSC